MTLISKQSTLLCTHMERMFSWWTNERENHHVEKNSSLPSFALNMWVAVNGGEKKFKNSFLIKRKRCSLGTKSPFFYYMKVLPFIPTIITFIHLKILLSIFLCCRTWIELLRRSIRFGEHDDHLARNNDQQVKYQFCFPFALCSKRFTMNYHALIVRNNLYVLTQKQMARVRINCKGKEKEFFRATHLSNFT